MDKQSKSNLRTKNKTMSTEKTKVGKFLQGAGRFLRQAVVETAKGGIPLATPIIHAIEGTTGRDLATGDVKDVDWTKIVWKAIGAGIVLYLVISKQVDVQVLLDLLKRLS